MHEIKLHQQTVFQLVSDYSAQLRSENKKSIKRSDVINFLDDLYKDKQTVEVKIDNNPIKFEGFTNEQVECFLKIFEGYKEHVSKNVQPKSEFEEVVTEKKAKVIMIPTPPLQ